MSRARQLRTDTGVIGIEGVPGRTATGSGSQDPSRRAIGWAGLARRPCDRGVGRATPTHCVPSPPPTQYRACRPHSAPGRRTCAKGGVGDGCKAGYTNARTGRRSARLQRGAARGAGGARAQARRLRIRPHGARWPHRPAAVSVACIHHPSSSKTTTYVCRRRWCRSRPRQRHPDRTRTGSLQWRQRRWCSCQRGRTDTRLMLPCS
jgi:hypothetical protein